MAVTGEILRSWRGPRAALRRQLEGATEGRALGYLMAACGLVFVAQWPRLAREAHLNEANPEITLEGLMAGALYGILFLAPLMAYALAALSHLVARLFGGRGSWLGARMALFWSLFALAPVFLAHGLAAGFLPPGPALNLLGLGVAIGFLAHWILALSEAESIGAA